MALVIAAPFLFVLFLVSLPIFLPFVGLQQARSKRRLLACVERSPCGWCVAPLGADALARAEALSSAYFDREFADVLYARVVRDLHACCPRCDAGHRYDEPADRFVLLAPRAFAKLYGELLDIAVPPATAVLAWPWQPPRAASHKIALTRDSVCMADDIDAPHAGEVTLPAEVDVVAIGEALLRSPWLAHVGATATWTCAAGPVTLVFGLRSGLPFVRRSGTDPVCAGAVASLHVGYAAQRDPDAVCAELARSGART